MHVAAHKGHVKILKWLVTLKNTVNEQVRDSLSLI